MVTSLQRTFTSLVHAHAGRTQGVQRGLRNAVTFFAKKRKKKLPPLLRQLTRRYVKK